MEIFKGDCLPALIGSLPMKDHAEATRLVLKYVPEIPLWVQLPVYGEEGMIPQFLEGLPGVSKTGGKICVDTSQPDFENDLLQFYDAYVDITEGEGDLSHSLFALTKNTAKGFFELIDQVRELPESPKAIKGQITGPITMGTGLVNQDGRAVFYDAQLRDAVLKLLALKAKWQVRILKQTGCPVIMFFDEPALAGYGSSAFLSITKEDIAACFDEVVGAVHDEGGLAGVHVCANTDWSLILDSQADIVSFDAFSYFDNFILYPEQIRAFMARGGMLAWGIVPTSKEDLANVSTDMLVSKWQSDHKKLVEIGIPSDTIIARSLITPSCGTGSLSLEEAKKVLRLTRDVSTALRHWKKI
ncbi:MAG: hypothetical protein KJ737_00070 [Proteobacteria bacterium]|nr:hypothetical protein [Pseudomonadota bacterium]